MLHLHEQNFLVIIANPRQVEKTFYNSKQNFFKKNVLVLK